MLIVLNRVGERIIRSFQKTVKILSVYLRIWLSGNNSSQDFGSSTKIRAVSQCQGLQYRSIVCGNPHVSLQRAEMMKARLRLCLQTAGLKCNPFRKLRMQPPEGGALNAFFEEIDKDGHAERVL